MNTSHNKGGKKKKNKEQANTSADTEGFLEHVMMTHEIEITKEDPVIKGVIREDVTKLVMSPQDLKQLQGGMSDEQKENNS